jgi:hypothetical protein
MRIAVNVVTEHLALLLYHPQNLLLLRAQLWGGEDHAGYSVTNQRIAG